jgi:hypothetical protein
MRQLRSLDTREIKEATAAAMRELGHAEAHELIWPVAE